MARKASKDREAGADGTKLAVNVGARKDIINSTIRDVRGLDGKIKTLQAERREIINKRIKGDLDMKVADFNAVLRLAALEDEDRNKFLDTLRETFEAVGIGTQLNFLDAQEKTDAKAGKGAKGYTAEEGRQAGLNGKSANDNPHKVGTAQHETWLKGWKEGQAHLAAGLSKGNGSEGARAH